MNKAVKAVGSLFSGDAEKAQKKALAEQTAAITKKETEVNAAIEGQKKARTSNRGLLAFIDDALNQQLGA